MNGINAESIKDTILWRKLSDGFNGNDRDVARKLATNLLTICDKAITRMKKFPSLHPQYTLHDEIHLLRVTTIMAKIIPDDVIDSLNPIEIALLILSAFFHDQGMIIDDNDINEINGNSEFKIFKQNWIIGTFLFDYS
jgi:hypothetical protein